jgi:hypothetical protein
MDLEQQLQMLVEESPKYDVPAAIMSAIINPVLKSFAQELKHLEYYIPQTKGGDWVITTLTNREESNLQKKVIYAFANLSNALSFSDKLSQETIPVALPVVRIIFQLLALDQVDSMVFMEHEGNLEQGSEIKQSTVQKLVEAQLRQLNNIAPNSNLA